MATKMGLLLEHFKSQGMSSADAMKAANEAVVDLILQESPLFCKELPTKNHSDPDADAA